MPSTSRIITMVFTQAPKRLPDDHSVAPSGTLGGGTGLSGEAGTDALFSWLMHGSPSRAETILPAHQDHRRAQIVDDGPGVDHPPGEYLEVVLEVDVVQRLLQPSPRRGRLFGEGPGEPERQKQNERHQGGHDLIPGQRGNEDAEREIDR